MRSQHVWTEKDTEGRKREVRAIKFGGVWRLQAKDAGEARWTYYEHPKLDDLKALEGVIARKYQRRRASAEDLASVKALLHRYSNE